MLAILLEDIEMAMTRRHKLPTEQITMLEFYSIFDLCHNRKLRDELDKCKLRCIDQLLCKLKSLGRVVINDNGEEITVCYITREPPPTPRQRLASIKPRDANNNSISSRHAKTQNKSTDKNGFPKDNVDENGVSFFFLFNCRTSVIDLKMLKVRPRGELYNIFFNKRVWPT
jgi:hypothetical protein